MPVLARLQSTYGERGLRVLAINIEARSYPLGEWVDFMSRYAPKGMADLTGAMAVQDVDDQAVALYRLTTLGTEVIVDRQGLVTFRSDGPSGLGTLMAQIDKVD